MNHVEATIAIVENAENQDEATTIPVTNTMIYAASFTNTKNQAGSTSATLLHNEP